MILIAKRINEEVDKLLLTQDLNSIDHQQLIIKSLIEEAFFTALKSTSSKSSFNTILNTFIIEKISLKIDNLFKLLPPLIHRDNDINEKIIEKLTNFKNSLIRSYLEELKDSFELKRYKKEQINQETSRRDFLINPNYSFEGDEFLENIQAKYFKKLVNKGYDNTTLYFKELFNNSNNKENSKIQLATFITEIDDKLSRLSKSIITYNETLNNLINISNEETKEYALENGSIIEVDLLDNNIGIITELNNELSNDEYLKEKILKFKEYAYKAYPFLSNTFSNNILNKTVFGSFNYDCLTKLYNEFNFFFRKEVTADKFTDVFTSIGEYNSKKIDFTNGVLGDYGSIIKKIHIHFSQSDFNKKSEYHKWWSDRFTFNGKDKRPDDIGRIKGMSSSRNISQINRIIAVLE